MPEKIIRFQEKVLAVSNLRDLALKMGRMRQPALRQAERCAYVAHLQFLKRSD